MIPVSSLPSPALAAGSMATTMRTKSGAAATRRASIAARVQSAPGTSSRISPFSSCRPRRVPS